MLNISIAKITIPKIYFNILCIIPPFHLFSFLLVGILKRIVVIDTTGEDLHILINPRIVETSGEQTGNEGCLSVPGKAGVVTRPNYVKAVALNEDMEPIEIEGTELLARAICHEVDHLDGHLYVEKVIGDLQDVTYDEDEEYEE